MSAITDPIDFDRAIDVLDAAPKDEIEWDTMMNLGRAIKHGLSKKQFTLGDWACLVGKKYGQDTIGTAATEVGERRKKLEEYRTVCSFFEKSARADIFEQWPQLSYSHLRLATYKFNALEEAKRFLEECAIEGWSVEKSEVMLKKQRGETVTAEKLIDAHIEIADIDPHTGVMIVRFIGGYCPPVKPGDTGRMVMHAAVIPAPELAGAS